MIKSFKIWTLFTKVIVGGSKSSKLLHDDTEPLLPICSIFFIHIWPINKFALPPPVPATLSTNFPSPPPLRFFCSIGLFFATYKKCCRNQKFSTFLLQTQCCKVLRKKRACCRDKCCKHFVNEPNVTKK